MAEKDELEAQWVGNDLFDLDGNKIGTVEEIRYGDVTGGLQWLVVNTGVAGSTNVFVPAAEVRRAGDKLSVRHTSDRVKDAPKVEDARILTETEEGKLCRYYGLQYGGAAEGQAEGCEDMKDVRPAG